MMCKLFRMLKNWWCSKSIKTEKNQNILTEDKNEIR